MGHGSGDRAMPTKGEAVFCEFCDKGRVIKSVQEMKFRQLSTKGYIHCRVMITVGVEPLALGGGVGPEALAQPGQPPDGARALGSLRDWIWHCTDSQAE